MFTVDLHSHILPGIDDGAENVDISLGLLREEANQGIRRIVLSSHFYPNQLSLNEYVTRRNNAWRILTEALAANAMDGMFDLRPAAEIRYSPALSDLEGLEEICIAGTKVLLIEFSTQHYPEFAPDVLYRLQTRGFIPLLAHVERFPWLRKEPSRLYDFVSAGAFAQFNSDGITQSKETLSFVKNMLQCGLLHGIGSDTHNLTARPPKIREAEKLLSREMGDETVMYLNDIAESLLAGEYPETELPVQPKKHFWDIFRK